MGFNRIFKTHLENLKIDNLEKQAVWMRNPPDMSTLPCEELHPTPNPHIIPRKILKIVPKKELLKKPSKFFVDVIKHCEH
jgi:hypothetical protein